MDGKQGAQPSLENLIEVEDLGFEILHPGGLELTHELAALCGIQRGSHVLDVACGTGESACYLTETLGAHVVGIDAAAAMVSRARKKAAERKLDIRFEEADAHKLPFADDTFDAVLSECTICLLDKEQALREMRRVVKPGGCVGFHDMCWREDTPAQMKARLAEIEGERPETLGGWIALCERAGLVEVQAIDRSALLPPWLKQTMRSIRPAAMVRIVLKIFRLWGIGGLMEAWESERIFQSRYTKYGLLVGRKPAV